MHIEERLAELILEVASPAAVIAATQAAERLAAIHGQERQLTVGRLDACREREARAAREYEKTDATYATVQQRLAQEWEETLLTVELPDTKTCMERAGIRCEVAHTAVEDARVVALLIRRAIDARRAFTPDSAVLAGRR